MVTRVGMIDVLLVVGHQFWLNDCSGVDQEDTHEMTAGLLELVSRGKMDVFFVGQPGVRYYQTLHTRTPPATWGPHFVPSKGPLRWGKTAEFELDPVADLARNFRFHIHLPTWLPTPLLATSRTTALIDASGNSYGYTSAAAAYIFEWIEVYSDSTLLQRLTPAWLDLWLQSVGTNDSVIESDAKIGRRTVPTTIQSLTTGALPSYNYVGVGEDDVKRYLLLPLPILGCVRPTDPPFPMRSATASRVIIRVKLRPLSQVIESFPTRGLLPFSQGLYDVTYPDTLLGAALTPTDFAGGPDVSVLYDAGYIPPVVRDAIARTPWELVVETIQDEEFALEKPILMSAGTAAGGVDVPLLNLEFRHPVKWVVVAFQRDAARLARTWTDYTIGAAATATGPDSTPWLTNIPATLALVINGSDRYPRVAPWLYRDIEWMGLPGGRSPGLNPVYSFLGATDPAGRNPSGTLNFSTVDKAALAVHLGGVGAAPIPTDSNRIFVLVFAVGYTVLTIKDGIVREKTFDMLSPKAS